MRPAGCARPGAEKRTLNVTQSLVAPPIPAPEPSTLALTVAVLTGLGVRYRHRRTG